MNLQSASESATATRGRVMRRVMRAPREDRSAVIIPPWTAAQATLVQNQTLFRQLSGGLLGLSWDDWRLWCRESCLTAAREYTSDTLRLPLPSGPTGPLIVGGHQPELFHPGVWAKNFAIGRLAQQVRGVSLHLIVDSDASAQASVSVPVGSRAEPRLQPIPFDAPRALQPWENVPVTDPELFATFPERLSNALSPWGIEPLVCDAWPAARSQSRRGGGLVDALTAARAAMEHQWGLPNLELPMSRVCTLAPFLWMVAAIAARLPEFVEHHNAVLREYRVLNRVRSRSHPVPDLARTEDWYEAPFWIWRRGDTQRDRLWVRRRGTELTLRDRREEILQLRLGGDHDAAAALEQLQELQQREIHLRTRALTTTMFARLGLADLFVHGLGGAKYDEMTDALMGRMFDVDPPSFLTVSATAYLPLGGSWDVTIEDRGRLLHQQRDLDHTPDRHGDMQTSAMSAALAAEKCRLVDSLNPESVEFRSMSRLERRRHYQRLRSVNAELAGTLSTERQRLAAELSQMNRRLAANQILRRREFSWVTFPAEKLQGLYGELFP